MRPPSRIACKSSLLFIVIIKNSTGWLGIQEIKDQGLSCSSTSQIVSWKLPFLIPLSLFLSLLEIITLLSVDGNLLDLLVASNPNLDIPFRNVDHNLLHLGLHFLALLPKLIQLFHLFKHAV